MQYANVRIWVKRVMIVCLIPIAISLLLSVLLYLPPIQKYVVGWVIQRVSDATGIRIKIDRVGLFFPLDIVVSGVVAEKNPTDTLLSFDRLTVGVDLLPLFRKQVDVSAIEIEGIRANTQTLLPDMEIQGILGQLMLRGNRIDLSKGSIELESVRLSDADITLSMRNSTVENKETQPKPLDWMFKLEETEFCRVAYRMTMESDSLAIDSYIDNARLENVIVDLANNRYRGDHLSLSDSRFAMDIGTAAPIPPFDPSHFHLAGLSLNADSVLYQGRTINAVVNSFTVSDRTGLSITSLRGKLQSDSLSIRTSGLVLETPVSHLDLKADIPWNAFIVSSDANMTVELNARLGKDDLLTAINGLPHEFKKRLPAKPLLLTTHLEGNLDALRIRELTVELPQAFSLRASGELNAVADSLRRSFQADVDIKTKNLDFMLYALPNDMRTTLRVPSDMRLKAVASLLDGTYSTRLLLNEDVGRLEVVAAYNMKTQSYSANVMADRLPIFHFMPADSLKSVSMNVGVEGVGLNPFHPSTRMTLNGNVAEAQYKNTKLFAITLSGELKKERFHLGLTSRHPMALIDISLNGWLRPKRVETTLIADLKRLDLGGLGITADSLSGSFSLTAEAVSDMKEAHSFDLSVKNLKWIYNKKTIQSPLLTLSAHAESDTTDIRLRTGDFHLSLTGRTSLLSLAKQVGEVATNLTDGLHTDFAIDPTRLYPLLPDMNVTLRGGQKNSISDFLKEYQTVFDTLALCVNTSPSIGLKVNGILFGLTNDTMRFDSIQTSIQSDSLRLIYRLDVVKNRYRRQKPFVASVSGTLRKHHADALIWMKDGVGNTKLYVGAEAHLQSDSIRLRLFPDRPIIGSDTFKLNNDNYVELKNRQDINADLRLIGANQAALSLYTAKEQSEINQLYADFTGIDLHKLSDDLSEILPPLKGLINAKAHCSLSDRVTQANAEIRIDDLYYKEGRVGSLHLNAAYSPGNAKEHNAEIILRRDSEQVMEATVSYISDSLKSLSGHIDVTQLPLEMLNPFIPDNMAKLKGGMNSRLTISGIVDNPRADGYLLFDTASVYVDMVGSSLRLDDKQISIRNNTITFDKYNIRSSDSNPFVINGIIDFRRIAEPTADISLQAADMELFNVKRNNQSWVYGKLGVNLSSTVKGPLNALVMRGDLRLLGNTNVTYVLKDSPLTAKDKMSNMVTFISFADTTQFQEINKTPIPMGGLDILMTIRIDPSVRLNVDLTPDQSNHVQVEGGGDLSFQYTPTGDMILNGRYTLTGGKVKYTLPLIPLKEFNIQNGSYIQWTGDPMDPVLDLTATERIRASVTTDGQSSRLVNFDTGIKLKQRLKNLGMEFVISSPEDISVQEQLTNMGVEEQQKQAVAMIITGAYMGMSGSGKMNIGMENALNNFLQSEINNLAGQALKRVDITLGVDSYDETSNNGSSKRTDYKFNFAKRFYNDRIRIAVGGRISTGSDINKGQDESFIDNISFEYRLDSSGSSYAKLFSDKKYQSLLEGQITETGVGIVLRKKMLNLRELFIFKKRKKKSTD